MIKMHTVCITGASSGIGAALARAYAKPGIRLLLLARNQERLNKVVNDCDRLGAFVESACIDVRDRQQLINWLQACDDKKPIDLLIANAGLSLKQAEQNSKDEFEAETILIDVHLQGTLNTIHAVINRMRQRQAGQIAIMSSINGFVSIPRTYLYGAVKAGLLSYGLALHNKVRQDHVAVSVICPGWVRSALTEHNTYKMPWLMQTDKAAKKIIRGLEKNKAIIVFPWQLYWAVFIYNALPRWLQLRIARKI